MSQINPLAGSILQSTQLQREQDGQKVQQVRRAEQLRKNIAAEDDRLEHQVESAEELRSVREDGNSGSNGKRRQPGEPGHADDEGDEAGHIDVTA
jgi:hypothetical protein